MKRFQYLLVKCETSSLESYLNKYGNQGWRCITMRALKDYKTPKTIPVSMTEFIVEKEISE